MRYPLILVTLLCGIAISSCKHYCQTNPYPVIKLSGFDSVDLDVVVFSAHNTNGGPYALPAVTTWVYSSKAFPNYDTLSLIQADTSMINKISLGFNTDATVYIPATGKTYTIRGVAIHRDTWENVHCTNSMSYYLNDTLYTQPMQPFRDARGIITITK